MKKTVIKSALITLGCIIVAFLTAVLCLRWFSPRTLGKAYADLGYGDKAVEYYEKQYDKTESQDDLVALIDVCILFDKTDLTATYGLKFVFSDGFNKYCEDNKNSDSKYTTVEYYGTAISKALYDVNEKENSVLVAVKTSTLKKTSPVYYMYLYATKNSDDGYLNLLESKCPNYSEYISL